MARQSLMGSNAQDVVGRCQALIRSLRPDTSEIARVDVASQAWKAVKTMMGNDETTAARQIIDEVLSAMQDDTSARVIARVIGCLWVKAELEAGAGREAEAESLIATGLELTGRWGELGAEGTGLNLLLLQSRLSLENGRREAALTAMRQILEAASNAHQANPHARARFAAIGTMMQLDTLSASGRARDSLEGLWTEFERTLDAIGPQPVWNLEPPDNADERRLADALAFELSHADWTSDSAYKIASAGPVRANRAVQLYVLTQNDVLGTVHSERHAVATVLRRIGDAYALLSEGATPGWPVVEYERLQELISDRGLDVWASKVGVKFKYDRALSETNSEGHFRKVDLQTRSAAANLTRAFFVYEMVNKLAQFGLARSVMVGPPLRSVALDYLKFGVEAVIQSPADIAEVNVAEAAWIIGERLFSISRESKAGWSGIASERAQLALLFDSEALQWFDRHGVARLEKTRLFEQ